jgi:Pyruvate/2-oxoacid:ferredoxin oxidoreductase gamma subunit
MDLCGTAVAAGAAWVHRATAFDKDLSDTIARAIEQPGFAMLDVWELCPAYYMERNKLGKKELLTLADDHGLKFGLLTDKPRPEYTERYHEAYREGKGVLKKRPKIEAEFSGTVTKQTGIIIAGSAGQRIKSSATLFAEAAMFAGLSATQKDDYPITVRTGHSVAEIILSPETIEYTGIDAPDYVLIISEEGLKRIRSRIGGWPETCTIFTDEGLDLPETRAQVRRLPFGEIAKKVSKLSVAIGSLSAMIQGTGMFPVEALEKAVQTFQSPKIAESSLKAVAEGRRLEG